MEQNQEQENYVKRTSKSQRFDKRLIKAIVQSVEDGLPQKEAIKQHGMTQGTLINWMNNYGSPVYYAGKKRAVNPSIKRVVLRAIESGMSPREAATAHGIKNSGTVRTWVRQAKTENAELYTNLPLVKPKEKQTDTEQTSLEQQLAEAQLKIRALETMIDIAEEQLKIDIRKKSGAKQSPK